MDVGSEAHTSLYAVTMIVYTTLVWCFLKIFLLIFSFTFSCLRDQWETF